jgi:hypothetical protein
MNGTVAPSSSRAAVASTCWGRQPISAAIFSAIDGAVGITLSDDTLLTAGPRSTLLINEFQFNSTTHEGGMLATLLKGTLSVVTGLIGKQAPENVHFRTPTVLLGIRGTEFIVDARAEDE